MVRGKKRAFVKRRVLDGASTAAYFLGLSAIVPIVLSINIPSELSRLYMAPAYLIITALILMVGGIYLQYRFLRDKKIGKTVSVIGRMTFVPGIFIMIFMIFGTGFLINSMETVLNPGSTQIITDYINTAVPRVWNLGIFYTTIGAALFFLGRQIEK